MQGNCETIRDEILVLQSKQGCADAFGKLVDRWQKRLWFCAFRITQNEAASWDIVQDTWAKAMNSLSRLDDSAAFPGWILRITNNLAIDWVRREIRQREAQESYTRFAEQTTDATHLTLEAVRFALTRLSGTDAEILTLFYFAGFKLAEISGLLGIPEGTAKSRLHYARAKIKTVLEEQP